MSGDIGQRVVAALGEPAARELLEILERSDADRAALIGRLHARDDAAWLAELLMDLADDVGEIARLRLIDAPSAIAVLNRIDAGAVGGATLVNIRRVGDRLPVRQ